MNALSLIPQRLPQKGEQYAFEVDLKLCTGCKGCVTACHSLNGLEPEESWRSIGIAQVQGEATSFNQTITTSCHHCLDPACMSGCPTLAYEKDTLTGIVKHLDDQCIGCQYCLLRCPYDAPKWIPALRIVRKCDLCQQRLAVNEEPACVQACPNEALKVVIRTKSEIQDHSKGTPGFSPEAEITFTEPATKYREKSKTLKTFSSLDKTREPEATHWPLVVMLLLTQASVGLWGVSFFLREAQKFELLSLAFGFVGLNASLLHLGRPTFAFRAILGWRTSWISREVLSFGLYAHLALATILLRWLFPLEAITEAVKGATLCAGAAGVWCSANLYLQTPRPHWNRARTLLGFYLTAFSLGSVLALLWAQANEFTLVLGLISLSGGGLLGIELASFMQAKSGLAQKSVQLMQGPLAALWKQRVLWGCLLPWALYSPLWNSYFFLFIALSAWGAALSERLLFFKAGLGPKMPIGLAG